MRKKFAVNISKVSRVHQSEHEKYFFRRFNYRVESRVDVDEKVSLPFLLNDDGVAHDDRLEGKGFETLFAIRSVLQQKLKSFRLV